MTELLNCPHCSSTATVNAAIEKGKVRTWVACDSCTAGAYTKTDWNTRATTDHDILRAQLKAANEENARWRKTHSSGEWNPDYCAASEALKDTLKHLSVANERIAAVEKELEQYKYWLGNANKLLSGEKL